MKNSISVGIDIGSTTTKVVVLEGESAVRAALISETGARPADTTRALFERALAESGLAAGDIAVISSTGYGRRLTDLSEVVLTEIKACALGVAATAAGEEPLRTVIDIGGQDTKVIVLDANATVEDFSMNDKCAAGTGRFLEMLAHKLDLPYEDFVAAALRSRTQLQMNATCAVFAESEVVGLLARGVSREDVAAAAHNAIAARVAALVRRVSRGGNCGFVGGGARNGALVKALTEQLGQEVTVLPGAQTVVALGAAVGGRRRLLKTADRGDS